MESLLAQVGEGKTLRQAVQDSFFRNNTFQPSSPENENLDSVNYYTIQTKAVSDSLSHHSVHPSAIMHGVRTAIFYGWKSSRNGKI